jgi:hypothetical protein
MAVSLVAACQRLTITAHRVRMVGPNKIGSPGRYTLYRIIWTTHAERGDEQSLAGLTVPTSIVSASQNQPARNAL